MSHRVVVAMSGGVDSSVAAALLSQQGFEVIGVTMQMWGKDVCVSSGSRLCCSVRDTLDAKAVCKKIGIRHEVLELEQEFRTNVIDYFVESYKEGLTPNPCIACNNFIKFGSLYDFADKLDAPQVATGHYARCGFHAPSGRHILNRSTDLSKDQSYVLFNLTQGQLSRSLFPLGSLNKTEVRAIARQLGFATADKRDSQDICFVRDRNKNNFLRKELKMGDDPGPITDGEGKVLGEHKGLLGYTIGQREGLGLAYGKPIYVVSMDQANNRLIVGPREDLMGSCLIAERVNWVSIDAPSQPLRVWAKIRSHHEPAAAVAVAADNGDFCVDFDEPQQAITPGQAVVFYDEDRVLGGGWIAKLQHEQALPVRAAFAKA